MRLWSLHPSLLDARGLVALWREGLLAQAVLRGRTKGYTSHPQLHRFNAARAPQRAIAYYLHEVHRESLRRGYEFDRRKIGAFRLPGAGRISVSRAQLNFEWAHLCAKLARRDRAWLRMLRSKGKDFSPPGHPLFRVTRGAIARWERV